jgi:hypothetical protein
MFGTIGPGNRDFAYRVFGVWASEIYGFGSLL